MITGSAPTDRWIQPEERHGDRQRKKEHGERDEQRRRGTIKSGVGGTDTDRGFVEEVDGIEEDSDRIRKRGYMSFEEIWMAENVGDGEEDEKRVKSEELGPAHKPCE